MVYFKPYEMYRQPEKNHIDWHNDEYLCSFHDEIDERDCLGVNLFLLFDLHQFNNSDHYHCQLGDNIYRVEDDLEPVQFPF